MAIPEARVVIAPVFTSIVATVGFRETHVPPEGVAVAVVPVPIHLTACARVTVGLGNTVIGADGAEEQPVDVSVQVTVAVPAPIPVISPALEMVKMVPLEDDQVPPVDGKALVVPKIQIVLEATDMVGTGLTNTSKVSDLQVVEVSVKTNLPVPADTPVTTPPLVTVAIAGNTETHVPPVDGIRVVVEPIQTAEVPLIATVGGGLTVTALVVLVQPLLFVNVKVAEPPARAVTKPPFVTEATPGLLLTHVPPDVGESMVVAPTQMLLEPVILTTGLGLTVNTIVSAQVGVEYINP